jgi:predicted esterase
MTQSILRIKFFHRKQWLMTALALSVTIFFVVQMWFKPPLPEAAASVKYLPNDCPLVMSGTPGRHSDLQTASGLRFSVVAPSNYQNTFRYGLLMMFPPAGFSNESAERFYQLTEQANANGYVVVFSAAIPLSVRALRMQQEVVPQVMAIWCIDPARVVFAGHSDGGSITTGLTVREQVQTFKPTSAVISAAGLTAEDLQQELCTTSLNITVLHNPNDELFPGFGEGAAKWWGKCMKCSDEMKIETSGCQVRQCSSDKLLRYCKTSQPHENWPSQTANLFEWIK